MLTTPVLEELVLFPETRTATVPLPMPELPLVTISHVTVLAALQMQLPSAVTATLTDSPVAAAVRVSGAMVFVHPAEGCEMVKVCPAIVSVVPRCVPPVLAATVSVTLPLPLPLAPFTMVTHDVVVVAVQAQLAPAVTLTVMLSPPAATVLLAGLIA